MRRTLGWLLVALLSIGLFYATFAWADEGEKEAKKGEMTLDKAPKPVQETVLKEAGKNKIEIVEVSVGDKNVYKVEWKEKEKDVRMVVAADGKIINKSKVMAIDDVPAPVKKTLTKEADKNKVERVLEITHNDKTIYEAEWSDKGKSVEIVVTPDGKITSVTKQIGIDDVPKPVKEAILKEAGANKIKDIEVVTEGDKTTYEAEWTENDNPVDIKLTPDGKIISREPGEAEKKEKENEGENEEGNK